MKRKVSAYKRALASIAILLSISAFTSGIAAQSSAPIAVLPFESNEEQIGDQAAANVLVALEQTRQFTLVERGRLTEVLEEISNNQGGLVETDSAVEVGELLGAQYLIMGEIQKEDEYNYRASVRILKTETGVVIGAEQAEGHYRSVVEKLSQRMVETLKIYLLMTNPDSPYSVLIQLDRGEEENQDARYSVGDSIRLRFKVLKHRDEAPDRVYIQLYSINARGVMTLIYPNKFSPQMEIEVGEEYSLPSEDDDFQWKLVPPVGAESIQAIVTTRPVDFFNMTSVYQERAFTTIEGARDNLETYQGIQVVINDENLEDWAAERVSYYLDQD